MNIDNNYKKYIKYKNKYYKLKQKNKIIQLFGGNNTCNKQQLFTPKDLSSVLDYVKNRYNCSKTTTTNKYFVILYGPPASGKTIARKIACDYIKKTYKEEKGLKDILNSFIDTGVDDIVYDIKFDDKGKSLKTHFIELLNSALTRSHTASKVTDITKPKVSDITKPKVADITKPEVDRQIRENIELYFKYRRDENIDGISALLAASASYSNRNVFFETASPSFDYIKDLINTLFYSKYKILCIYPYTNNAETLIDRSIKRGFEEGRIPSADFIRKMVTDCNEKYEYHVDRKNTDAIINMKITDIVFIKYNTELSDELFKHIDGFNEITPVDQETLKMEIIIK